jgi:hypothetical protein
MRMSRSRQGIFPFAKVRSGQIAQTIHSHDDNWFAVVPIYIFVQIFWLDESAGDASWLGTQLLGDDQPQSPDEIVGMSKYTDDRLVS